MFKYKIRCQIQPNSLVTNHSPRSITYWPPHHRKHQSFRRSQCLCFTWHSANIENDSHSEYITHILTPTIYTKKPHVWISRTHFDVRRLYPIKPGEVTDAVSHSRLRQLCIFNYALFKCVDTKSILCQYKELSCVSNSISLQTRYDE